MIAHMFVTVGRADAAGVAMMLVINGCTPLAVAPVDISFANRGDEKGC